MIPEARDNFNHILQVEPEAYDWSVSPELATISASGVVSAVSVGEGLIEASFHDVSASVRLGVGTNSIVNVDDFTNTNNFTISGSRIDLAGCSLTADNSQYISTPTSGRLAYNLTTGGTSVLYLNCNLLLSGTPESVSLNVYGDNSAHWLRGEFKNSKGELFILNFNNASPGINWDNSWKELKVPLSTASAHWGNPSALLSFPITWTKIYLAETDENKKDSGVIYLDDFKVNFITTDIEEDPHQFPPVFRLEKLYPNPFNASTNFHFNVVKSGLLELRIFSVDGREVDVIKQMANPGRVSLNWEPENLSSGVYLFQATQDHSISRGKCLLLK